MKGKFKHIFISAAFIVAAVAGVSASAFALSQAGTGESQQTYVAMGDSVAAGMGLGGTDVCDRSPLAYPNIVANSLGMSVQNVACSGAKADEGIYGDQERGGQVFGAQLDKAFANGTPQLITLTVGANDVRWVQFVAQCYYYRCGYAVDTARAAAYLADYRLELNWIMAQIYERSGGNPPTVLVNGYYDPVEGSECAAGGRVTASEAAWLSGRTEKLNNVIRQTAAKYSFAHFVPVNFTGHGLCSAEPWVQGVNDPAPFHPNAAGQQAIAQANIAKYGQVAASTSSGPVSWREEALDWFGRLRERANNDSNTHIDNNW